MKPKRNLQAIFAVGLLRISPLHWLIIAVLVTSYVQAQENCFDGNDNDGNGFIDLNDPLGCECQPEAPLEFIENVDFESFEVCPTNFSQFGLLTGEYYITNGGSTDYYNNCGYVGGGLYPDMSSILGGANGQGVVGFYSDNADFLNYREYATICLSMPLEPGTEYVLSFDVATTGFVQAQPNSGAIALSECSSLPIALYGNVACPVNIGDLNYAGCLSELSDYVGILEESVAVSVNDFTTYTFTFSVNEPIFSLALGGGCAPPTCESQDNNYFYLDNWSVTEQIPSEITPPSFTLSGNACTGFIATANELDFESYQWYLDGVALNGQIATNLELGPGINGDISLGVTVLDEDNQVACAFSNPTALPQVPGFSVSADFDPVICPGETIEVQLEVLPEGDYSFDWSTGATSSSVELGIGGISVLVTDNATGCTETFEAIIQSCEEVGVFVELQDIQICLGESAELVAEVSGGEPPYTFSWSPPLSNSPGPFDLSPTSDITYELTVTDINGEQGSGTATMAVSELTDLSFTLGPDTVICQGSSVDLVPSKIDEEATYTWNTGANTTFLKVTQQGIFQLTAQNGCTSFTDEIVVTIFNENSLPNLPDSIFICQDSTRILTIPPSNFYNVAWTDGFVGISRPINEPGIISVLISSQCIERVRTVVVDEVDCLCEIYVPNAFTPNGDGINDFFKVVASCRFRDYSLRIFNRWSNLVFEANSVDQTWIGDFDDNAFHSGNTIYNYLLEATPSFRTLVPEPIVLRGSISVLR